MGVQLSKTEFSKIEAGYDSNPARSYSLNAAAYTDQRWYEIDQSAILRRTWQWVCHAEKLRESGSYVTASIDNQHKATLLVCLHRCLR